MPNKSLIEKIEAGAHFDRLVIEKVLVLTSILEGLSAHEIIGAWWLLKGGTALNLLYLDLPRLSVDIDLNFVGKADIDELPAARRIFEEALRTICEREKCSVKRIPTSHAGGKLRLRFDSIFGGTQNLEVDINYVSRVPLFGGKELKSKFPPKNLIDKEILVPSLAFEELAAGKFTALISRFAARDAYDAFNLLEREPDLLHNTNFRLAFVCCAAATRVDIRDINPSSYKLDIKEVEDKLIPLLQRPVKTNKVFAKELAERLTDTAMPAILNLANFTNNERAFLDLFLNKGEIEAEMLTEDKELQGRIAKQPMLLWKQQHIKARLK